MMGTCRISKLYCNYFQVLTHLVNHLGHYPLGAGPSRMDSLISEHEDNPSVEENELLSSILSAPNVQVGSISAAENSYFSSSSSLQGVLS